MRPSVGFEASGRDVAQQRGESRYIALEGFNRSLQKAGLLHVFPSDVVAGRLRQVAYEFALGPAIALTERMQRVQFPEIARRALAEGDGVESRKAPFLRELLEDARGGAGDVRVMGEQVAALADTSPNR